MLTPAQLKTFDEHGYLVINDVVPGTVRQTLIDEYSELIDSVAEQRGQRSADWGAMTFEQRFTRLVAEDPEAYECLDISLPLREGLDENAGMHAGPAVFELLIHPRILDIVESVIGPEIYSNPVQHVRIKPPEAALNSLGRGNSNLSRTGWHQDAAVVVDSADAVPILTVWIAITDATPERGCMQAIPGSHRWASLGMHCPGRSGLGEIFIPQELVKQHQPVNLSVRAGGLVLLHKKTWHGAGPNTSQHIRWSFDLRYQPPGYSTGRDCFPGFLARSSHQPDAVLTNPREWAALWEAARHDIASGARTADFNERWAHYRDDPLCA